MNVHHALIDDAAAALEGLEVVFVGGAVLPLLFEMSIPARETEDVDCVVMVRTRAELAAFEAELRRRGLRQPLDRDGPVCRWWTTGDRPIDLMPVVEGVLGFTNRWYEGAFNNAVSVDLESGRRVRVAGAPWLLATKIEAFRSRGADFPYGSHDLEDIFALIRARPRLTSEAGALEDGALRTFLISFFNELLEWPELPDLVDGHMEPPRSEQRRIQTLGQLRGILSALERANTAPRTNGRA